MDFRWFNRRRQNEKRIRRNEGLDTGQTAESLYCEVAMMRLQNQIDQIDSIDNKASAILGIGSVILPVTASLLTEGIQNVENMGCWSKASLFGASFSYALLFLVFTQIYRVREWDNRPELGQWKEISPGREELEIQQWLGDACVQSWQENQPKLAKKADLIQQALHLLGLEVLLLMIAVLAPLF